MRKLRFIGLDVHKDTIAIAIAEEGSWEPKALGTIPRDVPNERVFSERHAGTQKYRNWLAKQKFDIPCKQCVMDDDLKAVDDATERVKRLSASSHDERSVMIASAGSVASNGKSLVDRVTNHELFEKGWHGGPPINTSAALGLSFAVFRICSDVTS